MVVDTPPLKRCAVYTRKSTEDGLEQAFNSLDAQHEACSAHVLSHRLEGWGLVSVRYDDGGFSGGNIQRPALKRLLADVKAGLIDIVVVYKIDRLSRSLTDFVKIVDLLETAGTSFVSVTQAFNTSSSMGRLTLNMLLSFAQFEREVTAERIRDKVAASKARGMWMGGVIPLGYTIIDRKLVVVPDEAITVRTIMQQFLEANSAPALLAELSVSGIVAKTTRKNSATPGGRAFTQDTIRTLLSNPLYVGEVPHYDKRYPGEHEAIVDRDLFEAVQTKLAVEAVNLRIWRASRRTVAMLAGMIFDGSGRPMSISQAKSHGRPRVLYVSDLQNDGLERTQRLLASKIDAAAHTGLVDFLRDAKRLQDLIPLQCPGEFEELAAHCLKYASWVETAAKADLRDTFLKLGARVTLAPSGALLEFPARELFVTLKLPFKNGDHVASIQLKRQGWFGHEARVRSDPPTFHRAIRDENLVGLIARGFALRDYLTEITEVERSKLSDHKYQRLERVAQLAWLAPDIIRAILSGHHPNDITVRALLRMPPLPALWADQRTALGFRAHAD